MCCVHVLGRLKFHLPGGGGIPPHPKRHPPCNGVGWDGTKSFDCQN